MQAFFITLGRYSDPEEIAQLVLFLASDISRFLNGTTQVIDDGMNANFIGYHLPD